MANQGGRYVVDGSGNKTLVERTDWQPPVDAPPQPAPAPQPGNDTTETDEVTDDDHALS